MKREKQTTSLNKLIIKVKESERIQKILEEYFENITL